MNIISGYGGAPHVSSQQWRDENIAVYGVGTYILNVGSKLAATVVSANEITIADGLVIAQGCTAEVERGTTESIAVDNGEQGMLRKDLIVLRYTKDASTNIEDMELDIIKGTPASSNPVLPSYTSGSIADGDTLVEIPIYTININGITIQSVTAMVGLVQIANKSFVESIRTTLQNSINSVSSTLTTVSNRVGTATLNTTAKNAMAAINELLTKINTLTTNLATTNSNVTAANNRINTTNSNLSTTNSNVTAVSNRVTALETKTEGLVRIRHWNVNAGATQYLQLHSISMYVVIINGASSDNAARGLYLVGVSGSNVLGIKAVSTAGSVAVTDAGNGLIKFVNNGNATMRLSIICTYGTSV